MQSYEVVKDPQVLESGVSDLLHTVTRCSASWLTEVVLRDIPGA
jgi:hypothetical protein